MSRDGALVWGEGSGSGEDLDRALADLRDRGSKCDCHSRKFLWSRHVISARSARSKACSVLRVLLCSRRSRQQLCVILERYPMVAIVFLCLASRAPPRTLVLHRTFTLGTSVRWGSAALRSQGEKECATFHFGCRADATGPRRLPTGNRPLPPRVHNRPPVRP
jgi:hypothetical protein